MYRPFHELILEDPFYWNRKGELDQQTIMSEIKAKLHKLEPSLIADVVESYFIDMPYGSSFGLKLTALLISSQNYSSESLGFILTYLSLYQSADSDCDNIRQQIKAGNLDEARKALTVAINGLLLQSG